MKGRILMRRLKGFTMTELMIALAVIGILVAVVTPAIMKTRPNQNKMMIKKSFYTVENIVSNLINDERLYPDMRDFCYLEDDDEDKVKCYWGFDYTESVEFEGETYGGQLKLTNLFINRLNVKSCVDEGVCYTSDGIKWDLSGLDDVYATDDAGVGTFDNALSGLGTIDIDVNGDKGPNVPCTADNEDCDQYQVQMLVNGKLRINPLHTRAIEYVDINTSIKDSIN